jgi:23S rRNA pseudouridine2604 synthase
MVTLKLKKPSTPATSSAAPQRIPVRGVGAGVNKRPTLAEAQAQRAEREARYQEQLRQRFGDRPPAGFQHRSEPQGARPAPRQDRAPRAQPPRARPDTPERDARYEDQLRQRFGGAPPPDFARRGDTRSTPRNDSRADPRVDPRAAPRGAPRADPRAAPRTTPRMEPRNAPQGDPRSAPRFDPRATRPEPQQERAARPPERDPRHQRNQRNPRDNRDDRDDRDNYREPAEHSPGSMRLSKRMSELGIASRREADEWIAAGLVRVDDQIVKELGSRVMPGQRITVDAKAKYQQAQRVTVLVNKPVGFVSGQAEDGYEPAVVLVTPANQWRDDRSGTRFLREHLRSLVPAGRLDIDSVGLLVLTQDGRVAKQLIGEDSDVEKEYLVRVATLSGQHLPDASLALLCDGLELDGEALRPALVEWVNDDQLRFVLKQGKKRQIRRMCEAVGLQVLGLKRVRIGKVVLGDLPPGQWRYLRMDESFV